MVEFTKAMSVKDIIVQGYKDYGYAELNSSSLSNMIMKATVENKYDLIVRTVDSESNIFQLFLRELIK